MPRPVRYRVCCGSARAQCRSMMHYNELASVPSDRPVAPPVRQPERLRPRGHARPAGPADLRSHQRGHRRPRRRTRPPGPEGVRQVVPLPPAAGRAIDRAAGTRTAGPILLNSCEARMDRHAASQRLRRVAEEAGVRITRPHPHMLRHTVTTMPGAGVDPRDVQIAARHADPRTPCVRTVSRKTPAATRTTSSPPTWHRAPDQAVASTATSRPGSPALPIRGSASSALADGQTFRHEYAQISR